MAREQAGLRVRMQQNQQSVDLAATYAALQGRHQMVREGGVRGCAGSPTLLQVLEELKTRHKMEADALAAEQSLEWPPVSVG